MENNKTPSKPKRIFIIIAIILAIIVAICLIPAKPKTVDEIRVELSMSPSTENMTHLVNQKNFEEAATLYLSSLREDGDFAEYDNVIKQISETSYYSDEIKNDYIDFFADESNSIIKEMLEYGGFDDLEEYANRGKYSVTYETLGKQIMKYAKRNGVKTITKDGKGGFYDNRKWKFQNSTKRVNPLDLSEWGVGTYREIKEYSFHGDFLEKYTATEWMTNSTEYGDNDANEYETDVFYKGHDMHCSYVKEVGNDGFQSVARYNVYDMKKVYAIRNDGEYYLVWKNDGAVYIAKTY